MKMKLSVIFGVGQMSLGICLKGSNNVYRRDWIGFFFEFIPQLLTLLCLFGYMDYLIIAKWLMPWDTLNTSFAPSIISVMIDMCLSQGKPSSPGELPIVGGSTATQIKVENILVLIVMVSVPLMLCVKPCVYGCCCKEEDPHK
jgi:V-type H+-transporting ATPase subunit a